MPLNVTGNTDQNLLWTNFKSTAITGKNLQVQYFNDGVTYTIWAFDGPNSYQTIIWIGTVPDSVIAAGYSQAQNNTDLTDFTTNYQPTANRNTIGGIAIRTIPTIVHTNSTVTSSGSQIITASSYGVQQINLIINIKAAPTGTNPTIVYTIQEVDPGDQATTFGNINTSPTITGTGVYIATITTSTSPAVKVSWTVTGTTPSFTQVYATVVSKATPAQQAVTAAPQNATQGVAIGNVTISTTAITPVRETTYNEQTSNFTGSVVSSSANDSSAGTGARTVTITYYDQNGLGPFTETVTLNGTTAVNLVNTNHCYIDLILVNTVGSTLSNVGTISLFAGSGGTGTLVGTVAPTDNRTFWGHHYVANGVSSYITDVVGATNGTKGGAFWLRSAPIPVSSNAEVQITGTLRFGAGADSTIRPFGNPVKVVGPARIVAYIDQDGTSTSTLYCSFSYYDQ